VLQPTPALRFTTLTAPGSHGQEAVQWLLKHHDSLKPIQPGWLYVLLCVVSLGIARVPRKTEKTCIFSMAAL